MLELVGLSERADDRVKGYSLGMRQRLAIGAAMLKAPELLILDEPTNGLDPAGMVEVRELVRRLGADGRTTVFLSSHLLAEVEAVCDAVTILRRGALVASGSVSEVLEMASPAGQLRGRDEQPADQALGVLAAGGVPAPGPPRHRCSCRVAVRCGCQCPARRAGIWASEITPGAPGSGTRVPGPHRQSEAAS